MKNRIALSLLAVVCLAASPAAAQVKHTALYPASLKLMGGMAHAQYVNKGTTTQTNKMNWRLALDYRIMDHLETGAYVGYSPLYYTPTTTGGVSQNSNGIFYGLDLNIHFLPPKTAVGVYLTGKIGGATNIAPSVSETSLEVGGGAGLSLNLGERVALFGEALGGKFVGDSHFNWHAGLQFRF